MKKAWLRILGFGLLAAVMVGAFLFNLSMTHNEFNMGGSRAFTNSVFTGLAALISVALFVWSIVAAVKESRTPEAPGDLSAQEKWEETYPKPAVEPQAERPKEKHSPGYWVKEFLRLAGIPALLILAIWLGSYYFFLGPLQERMQSSGKAEITLNEEKNKYDLWIDGVEGIVYADSVVEEEPVSLLGYRVPARPEGYTWVTREFFDEDDKGNYTTPTYRDGEGNELCISVLCKSWYHGHSVSLDGASHWEELTVNDCPGVLVEYESGAIELAWIDAKHTNYLSIRADALPLDQIQAMAQDFVFIAGETE